MDDDHQLAVFRFTYQTAGHDISPGHMWGTLEAIATLKGCAPLKNTLRRIDQRLLDPAGFYYEEAPTSDQAIKEPRRAAQ